MRYQVIAALARWYPVTRLYAALEVSERSYYACEKHQQNCRLKASAVTTNGRRIWTRASGPCHGLAFIASTKPVVCYNRRIQQHRIFAGLAARGKDSGDWPYESHSRWMATARATSSPGASPRHGGHSPSCA